MNELTSIPPPLQVSKLFRTSITALQCEVNQWLDHSEWLNNMLILLSLVCLKAHQAPENG